MPVLPDHPKTFSFAELLGHLRKPDLDSIVNEGILGSNAIMVIGGPPKSYKSFVSNTLSIDLVTGYHLFSALRKHAKQVTRAFEVRAPQRVLIFEQEIGEDDMEDRLKPAYEALSLYQQDLVRTGLYTHSLDHRLQLDTPEGVNLIAEEIARVRPSVVIFDPLIEFHTSDENSSEDMAKILRHLDWLREKYKFATIINHHEGKQGQVKRTGADRLRGSSVLYGKGDTFLTLEVLNRDASLVGCKFTVRRGKPIHPFIVKLDPVTMRANFFSWGSRVKGNDKNSEGMDLIQ